MPVTGFVSSKKVNQGPDPGLVRDQLACLQNLLKVYGRPTFAEQMLYILRKTPEPGTVRPKLSNQWNRRLIPFKFNRVQLAIDSNLELRNIFLKDRQGGYTTFMINIRLYVPAITEPGSGGMLISQNNKYAAAHFRILQRSHRFFGMVDPSNFSSSVNDLARQLHENLLHTQYSSRKE